MHSSLHEVVATGLDSLVSSLQTRMVPADQYTSDRGEALKRVIARLNLDHGPEAEVYLLAHWVLQVHELLQAQVTVITPEIALSDLERMQELANQLRLNEEYELLGTLRGQIERGSYTVATFRSVSGGFDTIEQITTAMLAALGERMAVLGGSELRDRIGDPVTLLTLLADSETLARYLLNASRNRLTQCVILAHMVMIMRELQRLKVRTSPMTATADALRLAQLGEIIGVQPVRRAAHRASVSRPGAESSPPTAEPESYAPVQEQAEPPSPEAGDGSLTIDLSQTLTSEVTAPPAAESEPASSLDSPAIPEPPVSEPPVPEPSVSQTVRETEPFTPDSGSGIGRMIGMLLLAFVAVALLIVFVVRPPWLEGALDTFQELTGGQIAVPMAVTEVPTPTSEPLPTTAPTATATPVPPTLTPTPEPTSPALAEIVTANTNLALYEWPHLLSDVMDTVEQGTVVIPIQVVTGLDQRWLRLNDGRYVLGDGVDNVPTELPEIAVTALEGMPEFSPVPTGTPTPEPEAEAPDSASETETPTPEPEVEETEPAVPYVLSTIRMRSGPGAEFQDKGELEEGTLVTLIGTNVDATWFMLANRYWIPIEAVSHVLDGLSVRVPSYARVDANLRESASVDSRRVGGVRENDILVLVGQKTGSNPEGIWYRLDTGGWIYSGLVEDAPLDLPEVE